jgi:hypothetical protein
MPDYDAMARALRGPLSVYFPNFAGSLDLVRGTAFPTIAHDGGGLQTGSRFFRTDLGFLCYYDGAQWLTVHEYSVLIGYSDVLTFAIGAGNNQRRGFPRSDYKIYLTRGQIQPTTGATNNGTNYFTYNFTDGTTTVWTFNTSADAINTLLNKSTTTFTQPTGAGTFIRLDLAATGAPSNHSVRPAELWYRLVVT